MSASSGNQHLVHDSTGWTTYESMPSVMVWATLIGAPRSSSGGPTLKTCKIDASAIASVDSAK